MRRLLHRLFTSLTVLTAFLLPSVALAQENSPPTSLIGLEVRLWPEFDNNDLLVIAIGQLAPDTQLPTTIEFTLPENADLNAVAEVDGNGAVLNAAYTETGSVLLIEVQTGTYQVEYYMPVIEAEGDQRSYEFSFTTDYPVDNLIWQVQQPPNTGSLVLSRETDVVATDQFGFPSYLLANQSVEAGATLLLSATYERANDQLTADFITERANVAHSEIELEVPASPAITRQSAGRWIFYLGAAGLVITMMAIVAVTYFRKGSQLPAPTKPTTSSAKQFCTECGAKFDPNGEFCTQCGATRAK